MAPKYLFYNKEFKFLVKMFHTYLIFEGVNQDFQKSGYRLKGRKSYHEFTLDLFVEIEAFICTNRLS